MFRTLLVLILFTALAAAQKRVALVVGIGAYQHLPVLANPTNDAALIGSTLKDLGFSLVGGAPQINLDKTGFDRAIRQFGAALQDAEIGVFYFAGHGLQVQRTSPTPWPGSSQILVEV